MSQTLRSRTRRSLLLAALLSAAIGVFAQTPQYTWRNVQVYGGQ